jgi:hypothetical protein
VAEDLTGPLAPFDATARSFLPKHRRFLVIRIANGAGEREMPTMHRKDIAVLRTQLRDVNIEYSALVRTEAGPNKPARMDELKARRQALMALIAEAGHRPQLRVFPVQGPIQAVVQAA